jgi:hypothetical protein
MEFSGFDHLFEVIKSAAISASHALSLNYGRRKATRDPADIVRWTENLVTTLVRRKNGHPFDEIDWPIPEPWSFP